MPLPKIEKEIRGFLGHLQYISLTVVNEVIFKNLKKGTKLQWDQECHEAFDKIKGYLSSPLVLMAPYPGIPLILYLTTTTTVMGAMLAQKIEGEERVIYFTSKKILNMRPATRPWKKLPWP